ncbi:MAG: L-type lectin-domain containing protein, partial [Myxococcota bacterium]
YFATVLLMPSLAWAQNSVEEFALGGSASLVSRDCIRLTPDEQFVSGSAWYKAPVNLTRPFEMELKIVLGEKDLEGADGIVFVFHPSPQTGWRGEGMGFAGLVPSLGIEFDTYQNFHLNDPAVDHLALLIDGEMYHGPETLKPVAFNNLEDGKRHPLKITWEPSRGLKILLDGKLRAAYPPAVVKNTFSGTPIVYWGMTAGTGRLSNYQDVCIEKLFIGA